MQEIKKRTIVIASVLKPVDDTRMFEKIGKSLSTLYAVHILGFATATPPQDNRIRFYPLYHAKRLNYKRLLVPWKVFRLTVKLKPAVLIITTHELIFMALLARLWCGCRIVYDVQENYYRNIRHGTAFPPVLRSLIAGYVRFKEWLSSFFIDHYFLAEKGYAREFSFPGKHQTILENKFKLPNSLSVATRSARERLHFLFTGTLAESTGVFMALEIVQKLRAIDPRIRLTLCGYCAQQEEWQRLRQQLSTMPWVELLGGDVLVPHSRILQKIQEADIGIVSYRVTPATEHAVPTKLYEYVACRLPILLIDHAPWVAFCESVEAAVVFNEKHFDAAAIMQTLRHQTFYTREATDVFWDSEEPALLQAVANVASMS